MRSSSWRPTRALFSFAILFLAATTAAEAQNCTRGIPCGTDHRAGGCDGGVMP
jgi:hypothetical protein